VETAYEGYEKLKRFWAVEKYVHDPAGGWPKRGMVFHRHLFWEQGSHHAVRWMPNLLDGWRRMTYQEFYNLKEQ